MVADPTILAEPWPVERFAEIDSTNLEARRRSEQGETGPVWLTASRQVQGRGRLGRNWTMPEGNLAATALFPLSGRLADAPLICFAAGLAVVDAAEASSPGCMGKLALKWPNDVLSGAAKLCGILIETGTTPRGAWVAAGFGVNLAAAPERVEQPTVSLSELGNGLVVTPEAFLAALDEAFRSRLAQMQSEGFEATRSAWIARAAYLGREVVRNTESGILRGVMQGIAEDGALILELPDGRVHHVRAGEVSVLN